MLLSFLSNTYWASRPDDLEKIVALFTRAWAEYSMDAAFDLVALMFPGCGIHGQFSASRDQPSQSAAITWANGETGMSFGRAGLTRPAHMVILAAMELLQKMWMKEPSAVKGPPISETGPPFKHCGRVSNEV
jgi:hypothetical protein